jgi:hypothetical protein
MRRIPEYLIEDSDNLGFLWIRKCPKCNCDIIHRNFESAKMCHKQKRLCYTCGSWNKGLTKNTNDSIKKMSSKVSKSMKELRKHISPWNTGLTKENNTTLKIMGDKHYGFRHTNKTKKIIGNYSKNFWKNKDYRNKIIEQLKLIFSDEKRINEWRLKMESGGYFTPLELKSDFEKYKQSVWNYTRKNNLSILENYNKRGRSNYHLDHKYSITKGFLDNIPPKILGCIHNLEMLTHKKNIVKNSKCSISKEKLLDLYYDGENKI